MANAEETVGTERHQYLNEMALGRGVRIGSAQCSDMDIDSWFQTLRPA
jgi:hypothetical protein